MPAETRDVTEYPYVFFPVGLNLAGRRCVVIGAADDREANEKEAALREARADVVRFTDLAAVRDADIAKAFFVISTPQDEAFSARLRALADEHRVLLCAIDQPKHGFVSMQAVATVGPVRVAISTGGVAPRVGGKIRAALQTSFDATFERFIACLNAQRERNRVTCIDASDRRAAMLAAADGFEVHISLRYPRWFEDELAAARPKVS